MTWSYTSCTSMSSACALRAASMGGQAAKRVVARRSPGSSRRHDAGFAMMEVMISKVILLIGLLGLAGLIVRSNTAEVESLQRVQALVLVQDMVDRINANRKVASCYSADAAGMELGNVVSSTPACSAGNAQQNAVAVGDLNAWNSLLQGSSETSGNSQVGAMIGAVGCIKQLDAVNNIYLVSVAWQGMSATSSPGDTCGRGLYGNDTLRREVSVTLRIANLS